MNSKKSPLPEVRSVRVGPTTKRFIKMVDDRGKNRKVKEKSFTEADATDIHLIKLAPMVFFSLDSNKILVIPFSIKFTVEEYMTNLGQQSVGIGTLLEDLDSIQRELHPEDYTSKGKKKNK